MTTPDDLNGALRDLLDAAKRVQRMTGANIHVNLHDLNQPDFFAADFIGSDVANEDGDPHYGHVEGVKHGFLSRLLYRCDGVLYQLYMPTPIREKVPTS